MQLVLVMLVVTVLVAAVFMGELYRVAVEVRRQALADLVTSQAALIEEVAEHSRSIPEVLPLLWKAKVSSPGIGETGEFMIGRRAGDQIEFLLVQRRGGSIVPRSVGFGGSRAEPMQRALAGETGTMVGHDYRGVRVLAAYRAVRGSGWGLVAKMDLVEVRAPFWRAGGTAAVAALLLVLCGALVFVRLTAPIAAEIEGSEARFRAVFERAAVGKSLTAPDGRLLEVNQAFADLLGYTVDEVEALDFARVTHPDDVAESRECVRSLLAGESASYRMEKRYITKGGQVIWADVSTALLGDRLGNPLHFITTIVDISDRVRAERKLAALNAELEDRVAARTAELAASEQSFRIVAANAYDWEYWRGPDGRFLYMSPSCERVTGRRPEEFVSDAGLLERIIHPEDLASFEAHRDAEDRSRSGGELEFRILRPDGEMRWIGHECQPVSDEDARFLGIRGSNRDITERKRAEEAVVELNRRLSRTVAELEAANKEIEAFSYSVSHDLRAPLRAIDGFSRILLTDHADELADEPRRYLGILRDSTLKMGRLIDDLLDFSRLGQREIRREPTDVAALAREVVEELARELDGRKVEWSLGPLPPCHSDPQLLKLVLANLIGNSVKFTRHREPAVIEVGYTESKGEVVYFVRDNGAGFDQRYADKLFGVFQRLHREEEFEGTGAGLAICQSIIHRHGGRIWGEGEVDRGATFWFTLGEGS